MPPKHPLATALVALKAADVPAGAAVAIAPCSFDAALTPIDAAAPARVLLQVTPAQDFAPSDGRDMDVPAWRINADIARRVISAFSAAQPPVIDYEHQTLYTQGNGQPAPAAGWMHGLRWIEGRGLFAEVELTERARQLVAAGEYRYFSPVLEYERGTGAVLRVLMGALTNHPAIAGMAAIDLMAAASARFNPSPSTETTVTLLQQLLAMLGVAAGSLDEAGAVAACSALKAQADAARKDLNLADGADAAAVTAAVAALKAQPGQPDPAQYVPVAVVQELKTSLAALSASQHQRDVADVLAPALADGRLLPAEKAWADTLAATPAGLASLKGLLAVRQPVAALAGTQTGGQPPEGGAPAQLSADELAVAAACGIAPKDFAAARA